MSEDEGGGPFNSGARPSFKKNISESIKESSLSGQNVATNHNIRQYYIEFEIHISDTGCGISKENIPKLFMNFSRLEEHQKMNQRGTGLGLSICKSLIELMGGSVSVESIVGVGTTFIIHFKSKCKVRNHKIFLP